jgi:hypothetical protein
MRPGTACVASASALIVAALLAGCGSSNKPAAQSSTTVGVPRISLSTLRVSTVPVQPTGGSPTKRLTAYYQAVAPWIVPQIDETQGGIQFVSTGGPGYSLQVNTGLNSVPIAQLICKVSRKAVQVEGIAHIEQIVVNGLAPGTPLGTGALAQWPPDTDNNVLC